MNDLSGFEIDKILEISTGHMTVEDADALRNDNAEGIVYYDLKEFGWLVWCGNKDHHPIKAAEESDRLDPEVMSAAFRTILDFAWENEIRWVKFDKDSPHYDCFKVFDW